MKVEKTEKSEVIAEIGRLCSGAYEDSQSIRTASLNRIRDVIRKKHEHIGFSTTEKKIAKEDRDFSKKYMDKNLPKLLETMLKKKELTEQESDYLNEVLEISDESAKLETRYKGLMDDYIEGELIYQQFLSHVRGVGAVISAKLIRNFGDCGKYQHVSSLWQHCGFGVVDGHAPKLQKGVKVSYSPKFRTFVWQIGDSLMKQRSPIYREIYDAEKTRQASLMEQKAENAPKSKLHADLRARRKMVKVFLCHYYLASRELAGLEIGEPFVQGKLGHKDIIGWRAVVTANKEAKPKQRKKKQGEI